jgi:hypothetical protein
MGRKGKKDEVLVSACNPIFTYIFSGSFLIFFLTEGTLQKNFQAYFPERSPKNFSVRLLPQIV